MKRGPRHGNGGGEQNGKKRQTKIRQHVESEMKMREHGQFKNCGQGIYRSVLGVAANVSHRSNRLKLSVPPYNDDCRTKRGFLAASAWNKQSVRPNVAGPGGRTAP